MKLDSTRSKVIFAIFLLFFIGNLIYSLQYVLEAFTRSAFLSRMTVAGRTVYVEDTYYKSMSGYEYAFWLKNVLPEDWPFNVYNEDYYLYYHARFNYYLYPKCIPINENIELQANYGQYGFWDRLPYGNIVFAVRPKKLKFRSLSGIKYVHLHNNRYFLVGKEDDDSALLMRDSFINNVVLHDPSKWSSVYVEFNRIYPGKNINMLRVL